jgi:hypothetical protein
MVIRPATLDQVPISVIEVEEALDLSRRQLAGEPPYAPACSSDKNSTGMNQDGSPRATRPPRVRKIVLTANGCFVVPQPRTRTIQRAWPRSPGRLLAVLGVKYGVAVGLGPLSQHRDRVDQSTTELGELVFDPGRGLGVGLPGYQPATLEPAQRVGEHLAGDSTDQPGQVTVPPWLIREAVEDHDGPLVGK